MGYIWTTKDGTRIPVPEMTDRHVVNCWHMLSRIVAEVDSASEFYLHPFWGPSGEMAQEAAEQAMEEAWNQRATCAAWMQVFEEEMTRRGIEIPQRPEVEHPPELEWVEPGPGGIGLIAKIKKE